MFCIQTFLFEYDIVTSYMEDFSTLKCTAIAELFYVIISYCGGFPAQAVCPLWGAKLARFFSQGRVWEDSGCSPTSARDAPHSCLRSTWHKHECTTTRHVW